MEYVVGLQKDNQEGKYKLLYVICYLKYFYYIRRYVCMYVLVVGSSHINVCTKVPSRYVNV